MKKAIKVLTIAIIAASTLCISVAYADPLNRWGIGWGQGFGNMLGRPTQQTWVRLTGVVRTNGTQSSNGTLAVTSRTALLADDATRQAATASIVWDLQVTKSENDYEATFYAAKLVKANLTELNYQDNDFFLNGTWNVYKVTIKRTVVITDDTRSVQASSESTRMLKEVSGELKVTDKWTKFTLSIEGIQDLKGDVQRAISRMQFKMFKVNDDDTAPTVTKTDVASLAKAYGAMVGWGNYNQHMDFNLNYKIDVTDLATVAANVQKV
jgi:hypothetical protein